MLNRREFFKKTALPAGALGAMVYSGATYSAGNEANLIYVGLGIEDDFSDLNLALESIVDSHSENGYVVVVKPGIYNLSGQAIIPPFVSIKGFGQHATKIICSKWNIFRVSTSTSISDLTIIGNEIKAAGIITPNAQRVVNFKMDNVDMYLHGGANAAISLHNYNHVSYLTNLHIITDSYGLILQGYHYINSSTIFLSGENTGTDYVGIYVPGMCRLYMWSCKVGTGYGETDEAGYAVDLEVQDSSSSIIGLYIPASNTSTPRVELHGFESFCRNELLTNQPELGINPIRAESGWVRVFGGFVQSEVPLYPLAQEAIFQSGSGIVEVYGTRYSVSSGNIASRGQSAVSTYKFPDDNNHVLENWDGGVIFCDASEGDLYLEIKSFWEGTPSGLEFKFIKTDSSTNQVKVISRDFKLDSGEEFYILTQPYESATFVSKGRFEGLFQIK